MARLSRTIRPLWRCAGMLRMLVVDATYFFLLCLRPRAALAAENLFLRKQLALYQEGHVTPQRASNATRCTLVWLSQWFDGQPALTVVQPETFKRWRRQQFRLFWRGTSCPGRPPIPVELQGLIRQMARDNLTWGQRRMANELLLKLGLRVSPRTVRKYMPTRLDRAPGGRVPSQRWHTFLRNHARDLIIRGGAVDLTKVRRPCRHASSGSCSLGGAELSRASCRSPLRVTPFPFPCCAILCRYPQRKPRQNSIYSSGDIGRPSCFR
jgi:hypothetical protein